MSALRHAGNDALRAALPNGWDLLHHAESGTWTVSPTSPTSEALPGLARQTPGEAVRHWLEEGLANAAEMKSREMSTAEDIAHQDALVENGKVLTLIEEHDPELPRQGEDLHDRLDRILCPQDRYRVSLAGRRDLGIILARRTPAGGLITDEGTLYGPCAICSATPVGPAPRPKPGLVVQVGRVTSTVVGLCRDGVLLEAGRWASWASWRAEAVVVACADGAPVTPTTPPDERSYSNDDIPF